MSDFNITWLKKNLPAENSVIFDIGCADLSDSIRFRRYLPYSIIYAFECNPRWQCNNQKLSKDWNINYYNFAVNDKSGKELFYPAVVKSEMDISRYAGTMVPYQRKKSNLLFEQPVTVQTVSLNDFCLEHDIVPDFIHVDAEGKDFVILDSIDSHFLPKIMWAEWGFWFDYPHLTRLYESILSKGFRSLYNEDDVLFVRNDISVSPYESICWDEDHWIDLDLVEKEFLDAYIGCKDISWPEINSFIAFLQLDENIKQECFDKMYIDPLLIERYGLENKHH